MAYDIVPGSIEQDGDYITIATWDAESKKRIKYLSGSLRDLLDIWEPGATVGEMACRERERVEAGEDTILKVVLG